MHRILCVLNHNRETGKTATVRNLAAARVLCGKPALVIADRKNEAFVHEDIFCIKGSALAADREISGLFYLRLQGLAEERESFCLHAAKALQMAQDMLPPETLFFWDTPSALSLHTRTALFFAHGVLMPLMMEASAFDRLGPSLGLLEWVRRERQASLPLLGLLPVRVQGRERLSEIFSGPALALFRARMAPFPVPEDPLVQEMEAAGRPVFCKDLLSPAALAFHMLAQWVQDVLDKAQR